MKVLHYDAFTSIPNMGNPAGVVFETDGLTVNDMTEIAKKVGFNETVFIFPSSVADIKLRYFTPGHEMNLCGHGTVASLAALIDLKILEKVETIETKAGILDINTVISNGNIHIRMNQTPAKFVEFNGDRAQLSASLNISECDIDENLPIVYGNTGIWTLLIPIKKLRVFETMKSTNTMFPTVLTQNPHCSVHPFCLETYNNVDMHGRHFSSPYSGTIEDPATGTASGVMGAYYLKYISDKDSEHITVEQGQEIGKDAIIGVNVEKLDDDYLVSIEGCATFVKEIVL